MSKLERIKNSSAIAAAACISILLTQEHGALLYIGILGVVSLLVISLYSPWLGLLALFPLAFALRPAPPSVGVQEISFAALLAVVFIVTLIKLVRLYGIRFVIKFFAYPISIGLIALSINLAVSIKNNVPMADWLRGAVPFLFIYTLIPICALIGRSEKNILWIGGSLGTLVFLIAGHIVLYYFYHAMWQPYWIVNTNGETIKISKELALNSLDASGPMRDRITMLVTQATDAVLPVGLVSGFVISILAGKKHITIISALMAFLCSSAILITFTRSMLLSALVAITLFSVLILFFHKALRKKLSVMLTTLATFSLVFILATGMQDIWLGRMSLLIESGAATIVDLVRSKPHDRTASAASEKSEVKQPTSSKENADFNVSSRFEEYKIAWNMFLTHPLLGNGLGIKHEMRWETSDATSFSQRVAYVHNWPLYILMIGGGLGISIYSLIIFGPIFFQLTSLKSESAHWTVLRMAILTMVIYGLFFAVFRLITFNLLLGAAWGVIFAKNLALKNRSLSALGTGADSDKLSYQAKENSNQSESAHQKNMESFV